MAKHSKTSGSKTSKKPAKPAKSANPWVEFIRDYRAKHPDLSYMEVITSDKVKKLYKKHKATKKKVVKQQRSNIVETKNILKNPDYMPKGSYSYDKTKTVLATISQDPALIKAKIESLLAKGRIKITTKEQLSKYPNGTLVSYITKDGKYRSGGFLKIIKDQYFALQGGDYKIGKPISFPVQFANIKEMYVGSPIHYANRKEPVSFNFPVKIGGDIVYHAQDNFDRKRFMATQRFQIWKKWHDEFNFEGVDEPINEPVQKPKKKHLTKKPVKRYIKKKPSTK